MIVITASIRYSYVLSAHGIDVRAVTFAEQVKVNQQMIQLMQRPAFGFKAVNVGHRFVFPVALIKSLLSEFREEASAKVTRL
jgi:hypothetical protein